MKLLAPLTIVLLLAAAAPRNGFAQARGITGNGFNSGGINIKPKETTKKVTKTITTIQYVAVSPLREWKSSDTKKKPIKGTLLAFAREKQTGRVSIIEEDEVRLLVGEKAFTLTLDKLSADDQTYIHKLVDSARIAGKLLEPKAPAGGAEKSPQGGKDGKKAHENPAAAPIEDRDPDGAR